MLRDIHIADVAQSQTFYYAGRSYIMATAEEIPKHPACGAGQVLAYHTPDRGDRVPVSFGITVRVYVRKK